MRALALVLCLPAVCFAQRGKRNVDSVIEIDPWGRPRESKGEQIQIWQDEAGWHVRTLAGGKRAQFNVSIFVVDGKVNKVWGFQGLETSGKRSDSGMVSRDRKTISFEFKGSGMGEDGFDFSLTSTAKQLQIAALVDSYDHPEKIRIGANGSRAPGTKFIIPVASKQQ